MKKLIAVLVSVVLLGSLAACGGGAPTASLSPETAEPSASAAAVSSQEPVDALDELMEMLADMNKNYHLGVAGSSLTAVKYAGTLLDWYVRVLPDEQSITDTVSEFAARLDGQDVDEFDGKIEGLYYAAWELCGDDAQDVMDTAGFEPESYPWSTDDVETLFPALFAGVGMEPPALG